MNFLIVVIVSVVLATGVFNTETKDNEENKKTEIIVKETTEKKVNLEELAQAKAAAEAEAKAAAEAQEESEEIESSKVSRTNYLRLALYLFGSILIISTGAYFYFRQRDNSSSRSATIATDSPRDFRKEDVVEHQEEQPTEEEVKSETQEEQPTEEKATSETQEEPQSEDEKK